MLTIGFPSGRLATVAIGNLDRMPPRFITVVLVAVVRPTDPFPL